MAKFVFIGCQSMMDRKNPLGISKTAREPKPRTRRTKNYWEPIFDPDEHNPFPIAEWAFQHNSGPTHVTLAADRLKSHLEAGGHAVFRNIRFIKCDFFGEFDVGPRGIVFDSCVFEQCDFGLSVWVSAKFSNCDLRSVSLTQSTWRKCDFRGCKWMQIGMSGNETVFDETTITNPEQFIRSAYTNLDESTLGAKKTSARYQKMRLENTKATVSRALTRIFLNHGDERAYYEALKVSSNQSTKARIHESLVGLFRGSSLSRAAALGKLILYFADLAILNVAGAVNAWGRSIVRPAIIGLGIIAIFSLIYYFADMPPDWRRAVVKSTEVTLLVGYTNHSGATMALKGHVVVLINMLLGLTWYVVFIPTLVNRISRVR